MTAGPGRFAGFPAGAFAWFAGLEADNSKAYFGATRATYEESVRGALEAMLEELCDEYGGRVKLFRQHRDVRFSRDKSPYKTTTYGLILDRPSSLAGLYAQLDARGLFCGTGYHMLAPDQLERFRAAVASDTTGPELDAWFRAAPGRGLDTFGEALKTAPRGFPRDHPRAHLLRHKSLVAGARIEPVRDGIPRERALDHARSTWSLCAPLTQWLDEHVRASTEPPEDRYRRGGRPR